MRGIALSAAVIASGVLIGCSTVPTDTSLIVGRAPPTGLFVKTVNCASNCNVNVDVVGACSFSVPEVIKLSGTPGRKHTIVWVIQSGDYVFSTNSARPALDPKGSGGFFGTPSVDRPVLVIHVTVATPRMSHEYGLNIVKQDGTVCPEVDPFMIE